jgi:hypothetical protein
MDFIEALRVFSVFITHRFADILSISDRFISSSFLHHNNNQRVRNEQSYKILCEKLKIVTNEKIEEININNFLICCFHLFDYLHKNTDFGVICSNKDNRSFYTLLTSINSQHSQMDRCDPLELDQINKLKIIHSDMICQFNQKDDDIIRSMVIERVDQIMAAKNVEDNNSKSEKTTDEHSSQNMSLTNLTNKHKYEFFHLKNLINKQLRYNHHAAILKIHQSKQIPTVPSSLDFVRFPMPFFSTDQSFVDKQNNLIREYQKKTIDLIHEHIEEQISIIQNRILQEKDKINGLSYINLQSHQLDDIIEFLRSTEEKKLAKTFMLNQRRAEKCKNTPFTVNDNKTFGTSVSQDSSRNLSLNRSRIEKDRRYNSSFSKKVSYEDTNDDSISEEDLSKSRTKTKRNRSQTRFKDNYDDSGVDFARSSSSFNRSTQNRSNSKLNEKKSIHKSHEGSLQNLSRINNESVENTPNTNSHFKSKSHSKHPNNNARKQKALGENDKTLGNGNSNGNRNFQTTRKKNAR